MENLISKEDFKKLLPKQKIKLLIDHYGRQTFGSVAFLIVEEMYEDIDLLRQVKFLIRRIDGDEFKNKTCEESIKDMMQGVINHYFKYIAPERKKAAPE